MPRIGLPLVPACAIGETDANGLATVQIKVPGTFNGLDGHAGMEVNGRYLSHARVWLDDTPQAGDRITKIEVRDIDGVIPEIARGVFVSYPVIAKFYDSALTETANAKRGLWIEPDGLLEIGVVDGIPNFAASGLWIVGEFQSATAVAGRKIRANFYWSVVGNK